MKIRVLIGLLGVCGLGSFSKAHALCTAIYPASFKTINLTLDVGTIVVLPSDQVGGILNANGRGKTVFPITPIPRQHEIDCSRGGASGPGINGELLHGFTLSGLGNKIYNSNIPGIGIRVSSVDPFPAIPRGFPNSIGIDPYYDDFKLEVKEIIVEIIRTDKTIGSGTFKASPYFSYGIPGAPLWISGTVNTNSIAIYSASCEFFGGKDKTINLASVNKAGFKGIGSTQGDKTFELSLLCNGNAPSSISGGSSTVKLSFDYDQAPNSPGVMNNIAPDLTQAKGVGIQLLSSAGGAETIIKKGDSSSLGIIQANANNVQLNLPMKARYIQNEATIKSGLVKAQATVTLSYQ